MSRSDIHRAKDLLVKLANEGANFTPGVALELASMLCHIAGGDGRGVWYIRHSPTGDQIPPPWAGPVRSHGVTIDVDGASVTLRLGPQTAPSPTQYVVFEEAMDVAAVLEQAIARATHNAVEGHR